METSYSLSYETWLSSILPEAMSRTKTFCWKNREKSWSECKMAILVSIPRGVLFLSCPLLGQKLLFRRISTCFMSFEHVSKKKAFSPVRHVMSGNVLKFSSNFHPIMRMREVKDGDFPLSFQWQGEAPILYLSHAHDWWMQDLFSEHSHIAGH